MTYPLTVSGYRGLGPLARLSPLRSEPRSANGKGFPVTDTAMTSGATTPSATTPQATTTRVRAWAQRQADEYRNGEQRPLDGYLKLMSTYAVGTVGAFVTARKLGRHPDRLTPWDAVQLSIATRPPRAGRSRRTR